MSDYVGCSQCRSEIARLRAALAASEQRIIDGFISQTYAADLKKERDAIRAKLHASERALERVIDGTSHLICPHDSHTLGCLCACKGCTRRRLALASPGSPQEK